jgi:hypothetical protein
MAILNAGNIATQQPCSLLDVALGEFLFFAECAKTVTYNHGGIIPCRYRSSKKKLDSHQFETIDATRGNQATRVGETKLH